MKRGRKPLFVLFLVSAGVIFSLTVAAALILSGHLHFEATDRILRRRSMAAASHKDTRLLILGDSFLAWWPVEHCLYRDLDAYCSARNFGLINTAVGGFGPYEYLDQMRTYDAKYKLNLVILFYYAGNDLTDVMYRPDATPRQREGNEPVVKLPAKTSSRAGEQASPFDWEGMLKRGIAPDLIEKAKNRIKNPHAIGPDYVNPYVLVVATISPRFILDNILMDSPEARRAWDTASAQIAAIHDLAKSGGADLCIVIIPSTVQVDRSHYEFYRKSTFLLDDRLLDSTAPQDRMKSFCAQRGIPCVDLLPAFRSAPDTSSLYWENDDHLSEAGHILAFDVLKREFLDAWARARPNGK